MKAKGTPIVVRVLGENLVLFRDGRGRAGLLGLHCAHRGASLEFGRVEGLGLRCCYHGWLYDIEGRCLDQPAEQEENLFKDRVTHLAYQVEELSGLVFAYLGPKPAPLLPRYDLLLHNDADRILEANIEYSNWLQIIENRLDKAHPPILHARGDPEQQFRPLDIRCERTAYGMKVYSHLPEIAPSVTHWILPSHSRNANDQGRAPHNIGFHVPIDDESTMSFSVRYVPQGGQVGKSSGKLITEGWGPVRERGNFGPPVQGFWGFTDTDRGAVESQGPIADRTAEQLGASDAPLILMRQMLREAIEAVREGKDPVGIVRAQAENTYIGFDASRPGSPPLTPERLKLAAVAR